MNKLKINCFLICMFLFMSGCIEKKPSRPARAEPVSNSHIQPVQDTEVSSQLSPEPERKIAKEINNTPQKPTSLQMPSNGKKRGFNPASFVGPDFLGDEPMPVVVVLHGNYDRPEWECDTWKGVAGFYGWVLCPRGVPSPGTSTAEDRWTYRGPGVLADEMNAALQALEARYPGKVASEGGILAGLSLGAIYAPGLVDKFNGRFDYLFLVEGGEDKLDRRVVNNLKKSGIKGIGLAMGTSKHRDQAKSLMKKLKKWHMPAVFLDMKGSGHGYSDDFSVTGKAILKQLISESMETNK